MSSGVSNPVLDCSFASDIYSAAHHDVHVHRQVLHRDLSANNIMWDFDVDGVPIGILNDWDNAAYPHTDDSPGKASARHRTGTLPFMARDLLSNNPMNHLYGHDLESFFYILIWCCINYDFTTGEVIIHHSMNSWRKGNDHDDLNSTKTALFSNIKKWKELCSDVRPCWKPLVSSWLTDIRDLLENSQHKANQMETAKMKDGGETTVTGNEASWLRDDLTYDAFMKILEK